MLPRHGFRPAATLADESSRKNILATVRKSMASHSVDAFIVPSDDPHMSEYTAEYFNRREFLTGFSGSAGTAVVTGDRALLWTDARYFEQAAKELAGEWELMKMRSKGVPTLTTFLTRELPVGSVVGVDPAVHAAAPLASMRASLKKHQLSLVAVPSEENPIDIAWAASGVPRASVPCEPLRVHPISFAGVGVPDKLAQVRTQMRSENADALVLCALDEIAWLFNIRGSDIPSNPVAISYAVILPHAAFLCIDPAKMTPETSRHLEESGVSVAGYEDVVSVVSDIKQVKKVWLDGQTTNEALSSCFPDETRITKQSPIVEMKSCKNHHELEGMRSCHARDGAACAEFFAWLEDTLHERRVSECEIDEELTRWRSVVGGDSFLGNSFPTIAGVAGNGAIVHYRAQPSSNAHLARAESGAMCLIDSGGQYVDGTTDVTRTFHTGDPTEWQKEMFTRVLKGHIALDSCHFPTGTPGCLLDTLARQYLWAIGKDFAHGTGHGVGAALNVHEGPQRISPLLDAHALKPGMVISNEPGCVPRRGLVPS